jgi:hypothetical protein
LTVPILKEGVSALTPVGNRVIIMTNASRTDSIFAVNRFMEVLLYGDLAALFSRTFAGGPVCILLSLIISYTDSQVNLV